METETKHRQTANVNILKIADLPTINSSIFKMDKVFESSKITKNVHFIPIYLIFVSVWECGRAFFSLSLQTKKKKKKKKLHRDGLNDNNAIVFWSASFL